jgi:glycosyltransferase involved in cell wall biosynthesis
MNLLVCTDTHFVKVGDHYYAPGCAQNFFQRFRDVWEQVIVFGRLAQADTPPENSVPLDFSNVTFIGAPNYVGPLQYLKCRRRIMRAARQALSQADSVLLRGANPITMPIYYLNRDAGRPYGIEVIGDPYDSFAPGTLRHPLRPYFRWLYTREQRRACYDAAVTAYVTEHTLQRRYPPAPGRWTTHYSDVVIPPNGFRDSAQAVYNGVGPLRLASVGTMAVRYKAFDVLIAAVAQAVNAGCDLELSIIGDGQHLPELRQLAQRLGVERRVCFCGTLPAGQPIFAELDRAHVGCLDPLLRPARGDLTRAESLPAAVAGVSVVVHGAAYIGATIAFHSDPGDVEEENVGDHSLGPITNGDQVVVLGRHVYDGFHEGWHEIHPLMAIMKIDSRDTSQYQEWDPDFVGSG